jgi:hypothetical protein
LPPVLVLEIPGDGSGEGGLEVVGGLPVKLALGLRGIDRVVPVVSRAVLDEPLELGVAFDALASQRLVFGGGAERLEGVADRVDRL